MGEPGTNRQDEHEGGKQLTGHRLFSRRLIQVKRMWVPLRGVAFDFLSRDPVRASGLSLERFKRQRDSALKALSRLQAISKRLKAFYGPVLRCVPTSVIRVPFHVHRVVLHPHVVGQYIFGNRSVNQFARSHIKSNARWAWPSQRIQ